MHVSINPKTLASICENSPNLEEFYMPMNFELTANNCRPFQKTTKLRILHSGLVDTNNLVIQNLCPSLQYFIFSCHEDKNDDDDQMGPFEVQQLTYCQTKNNTVIATSIVADPTRFYNDPNIKLEKLKKVAPLIMPYTNGKVRNILALLAVYFKECKPIIEYLVKELHFDLNAAYEPSEPFYRPSFTYGWWDAPKYPIEGTINRGFGVKNVREIVELGALVECPEPHRSYLACANRADVRLFLLEHGANPNKSLDAKLYLPAYAYMFMGEYMEDSREIVLALKDKCDLSASILGRSLLYWAIRNQKWISLDTLLEIGLRLNHSEMLELLKSNPGKFLDLLSKRFYIMDIGLRVALQLIKMDWGQLAAPFINKIMNFRMGGYTFYHLMCMHGKSSLRVKLPKLTTANGDKYRWQLVQPENCSWRSSEQRVKDVRRDEKKDKPSPKINEFSEGDEYKLSIAEKVLHREYSSSKRNKVPIRLIVESPIEIIKPDVTILTKHGETGLLLICKANFIPEEAITRIEEQLSYGVDINQPDNYGWTPLHALCYSQSWEAATLLIQKGANVNAEDNNGVTPLMAAIYGYKRVADEKNPRLFTQKFISLLRASLKASEICPVGGEVATVSERTILHIAVGINDWKLTFLLRKLGDINERDADGFTPLHHAVMYGNNDVIKTLIENGADVNAQTNSLRLTPAMVLMQILSVFKTSVCSDQVVPSNVPYFKYLETIDPIPRIRQCWREIKTSDGEPLIKLCDAPWHHGSDSDKGYSVTYLKNCDEMLDLLTKSADLTLMTDVNLNTYLHFLIILYGDNFSGLNSWLVKHESLNQMWNKKNDRNESGFYTLCSQLKISKVYSDDTFLYDLVKKHNIDVMERAGTGKFPFYFIASAKWKSFSWGKWTSLPNVKLSVDFPERRCPDFFEILWRSKRVSPQMLKEMLENNPAYLNQQDHRGETFLMRMIRQICVVGEMSLDTLDIVLEHKSHVNIQDVNGNTALHIACQYFHLGAVEAYRCRMRNAEKTEIFFIIPFLLLEAGADPTIKNNRGETPTSYVPSLMDAYNQFWVVGLAAKRKANAMAHHVVWDTDEMSNT